MNKYDYPDEYLMLRNPMGQGVENLVQCYPLLQTSIAECTEQAIQMGIWLEIYSYLAKLGILLYL